MMYPIDSEVLTPEGHGPGDLILERCQEPHGDLFELWGVNVDNPKMMTLLCRYPKEGMRKTLVENFGASGRKVAKLLDVDK